MDDMQLFEKLAQCNDKEQMQRCIEDYSNSQKVVTNADRIRAMSDEELAEWLNSFGGDLFCLNKKDCVELVDADQDIPAERCEQCAMDWLQQPVKEE